MEKNAFFLALPELTPSLQFGQHVQLFSDVEIQDLQVSLGLEILYILYIYNLKQFKVKIIGKK